MTKRTKNTALEDAMVGYVRSWHLYGGGRAEDIFVEFGLLPREFFTRVLVLLEEDRDLDLPRPVVARMRKVCRARLWMENDPAPVAAATSDSSRR